MNNHQLVLDFGPLHGVTVEMYRCRGAVYLVAKAARGLADAVADLDTALVNAEASFRRCRAVRTAKMLFGDGGWLC